MLPFLRTWYNESCRALRVRKGLYKAKSSRRRQSMWYKYLHIRVNQANKSPCRTHKPTKIKGVRKWRNEGGEDGAEIN